MTLLHESASRSKKIEKILKENGLIIDEKEKKISIFCIIK